MGREEDMAAAHGGSGGHTLRVMDGRGRGPPTSRLAWMGRAQDVRTGWGHLTAFALALVSCLHKK